MELFGYRRDYLTLRLASMIYGILSVWMVYLLGSKMFNRKVGLIGAFLLSVSSWALVYSRICLDVSASVFFVLFCFYLYFSVDRPDNPIGYILLGGVMGLATYFYVPARLVFPIVVLSMIIRMIFERGYFRRHYQYFLLMIAGFLLSLHLQGGGVSTYFVKNVPIGFTAWEKNRNMWSQIYRNILFAYRTFFKEWGWGHSIIAERGGSFDLITTYSFLAGLVWLIVHCKKRQYRFLIIWVLAVISPMIITTGEPRRAVLLTAPVYLTAAVGIYFLLELMTRWLGRYRKAVLAILILALLVPAGYLNLSNYFQLYARARTDPGNIFVKERDRRRQLVDLMGKGKVFSDLYRAELGWPQGIEYEAWRLGFDQERYELLSAASALGKFNAEPPPCSLYLKSGELKIKKAPPASEIPPELKK